MACGCGKRQGTIERPIIAGTANGADPIEMIMRVNFGAAGAGKRVWVTGNGIDLWVTQGLAEPVA